MIENLDKKVEGERAVQSLLRFLSGKPKTTEEVADHLNVETVEAFVILRDLSNQHRVVNVTDFASRESNREIWVSGEMPLRTT